SLATATAGFRDEYYGLVAACAEWNGAVGQEPNRLVTVGAVEPLAVKWGAEQSTFGRRKWLTPWIDVEALDPKIRAWTDRQLQPKVVLATQSRLLEPVVDLAGNMIPATPLIAVHGDADDLASIAAVLLAPPVVAWAWQRWFGAALAVDAIKLAARQVLELPLPDDRLAWDRAAALIADAEPDPAFNGGVDSIEDGWALATEVAAIMNRAYGADDVVWQWWVERAGRSAPGAAAP
ncbi:MAG: hypothetical protein WBM50_11120, partial [Acidimicrobiales bacterium]